MHPSELKYSPDHIWLRTEDGGRLRLGITYYLQNRLKKVVFIELPCIGAELSRAEPFGTFESAKTTGDLISPVSGRVVEVNSALSDKPGLINKDPYGQGWLLLVEPSQPEELASLLTAKEYLASTDSQSGSQGCGA